MNAIELEHVSKHFSTFTLDDISFTVPMGAVMGLIGENGAGKSTTLRLLLGLARPDSGEIRVFGTDNPDKEHIGVVFDECCFPETLSARDVGRVLASAYKTWLPDTYAAYLRRFQLPEKKKIKDYSRGMKMKLSIAAALSHDSRLLVLDEATSGLDPVVRDEILDIFYDFMQDEQHAILMSSHITSDLERICDYITFIHQGRIRFSEEKDRLLSRFGVLRCDETTLRALDSAAVHGVRRTNVSVEALVERERVPASLTVDPVTLDEIMVFTAKEA